MTTKITLDLAGILAAKLQHGFHMPVTVDIAELLEYADDDWDEELDLDDLLARDGRAALVFSADDARAARPHLTGEQAWEVTRVTRDECRDALGDFLGDVADANHPTAKLILQRRLGALTARLRDDPRSEPPELVGFRRMIERLPAGGDPALEGFVAAALDDLEAALPMRKPTDGEA